MHTTRRRGSVQDIRRILRAKKSHSQHFSRDPQNVQQPCIACRSCVFDILPSPLWVNRPGIFCRQQSGQICRFPWLCQLSLVPSSGCHQAAFQPWSRGSGSYLISRLLEARQTNVDAGLRTSSCQLQFQICLACLYTWRLLPQICI